MTPAPQRRRLRYSLRTLFVAVTLVACSLGYELNWIRQRHAFLAIQNATRIAHGLGENLDLPQSNSRPIATAPGMLRFLGEPGRVFLDVEMEGASPEEMTPRDREMMAEAARLFPEAMIGSTHTFTDEDGSSGFSSWFQVEDPISNTDLPVGFAKP